MSTMDDYLFKLYREGKITGETALMKAHYPADLRQKMLAPDQETASTVKAGAGDIGIEIS